MKSSSVTLECTKTAKNSCVSRFPDFSEYLCKQQAQAPSEGLMTLIRPLRQFGQVFVFGFRIVRGFGADPRPRGSGIHLQVGRSESQVLRVMKPIRRNACVLGRIRNHGLRAPRIFVAASVNKRWHPFQMHSAPSMTSAWPVMKADWSEARKTMPCAISSGVPQRPMGMFWAT